MKRGYSVLKLADLASQLSLPSSKGYKTKDYLELVIDQIEDNGYKFIQFLQLVDVLYAIIQKQPASAPEVFRPDEEIKNHYNPPPQGKPPRKVMVPDVEPVQEREMITEAPPELQEMKQNILDKRMKKNPLPWEK